MMDKIKSIAKMGAIIQSGKVRGISNVSLKTEAIKEIKTPNLIEYFLAGRVELSPETKKYCEQAIKSYIKWKNNVTAEDLK